jgi:hypothetical protein
MISTLDSLGNQISWYLKQLKIPGIVSGTPNLEKGGQPQILISNSWSASLSYPANQISWHLKQLKIPGIVSEMPNLERAIDHQILILNSWSALLIH